MDTIPNHIKILLREVGSDETSGFLPRDPKFTRLNHVLKSVSDLSSYVIENAQYQESKKITVIPNGDTSRTREID